MSTTVDLGKITASVSVGTTTTGAAGTNASVSNSGTTQDAVLDFIIPRGAQGVQGPQGSTGPQGPAGPTGPQGPMGDVAVITPEQQAAFTMYSTTGQNTDGPMTQKAVTDALVASVISYDNSASGLASNNVQGALDEISYSTLIGTEINISSLTQRNYRITSSKNWTGYNDSSNNKHYFIPCDEGDIFRIVGGSSYPCNYIFVKTDNYTDVKPSSKSPLVNYCPIYEGVNAPIVGINSSVIVTAPPLATGLVINSIISGNNVMVSKVEKVTHSESILKELLLLPELHTIYFNNLALLTPSASYPLNNYTYSGGLLTCNFTSNTNEVLAAYVNGLIVGNEYKVTATLSKNSNLGGYIQIGTALGRDTSSTAYKTLSASTTESTYTFNIIATSKNIFVGAHSSVNKGETYVISSIVVENADSSSSYITETAKKISAIEKEINPTITDLQEYITLNAGKDIFIPAGTYVCDNLTIPNGTRLHGIAGATILQLTNGATSIINLTVDSSDITIDGIKFVGNNDMSSTSSAAAMSLADLRARNGEGSECGIYINGFAKKIFIQNCEFTRFSLAGIRLYRMHTSAMYVWKVKITDCHFTNNWYGLLSDVRSEYHTIMGCSFNYNQIGAFVAGGNNTFSECRFEANGTGFVVSGTAGENDSHGSAGTCSFNHNKGYGIAIIDINNGYSFTGCHVFDGTGIIISNSIGFNYVGGMVACKIIIDSERNAGYNMFAEDIFTTTYNSGTIEGNPTKLSLHGNRFLTQNNCSSINNEI